MLPAPQLCESGACGSSCCSGVASTAFLAPGSANGRGDRQPGRTASKLLGGAPTSNWRSLQQESSEAAFGSLTSCFSLGCVVAAAAVAQRRQQGSTARESSRRGYRSRNSRNLHRTQRNFFGNVEQLNPFYEAPEKKTQKRLQPRIDEINGWAERMTAKSDDELRAVTHALRERCANGESLDSLLPEAFAAVREASWRVLGLRHFDVQLMGGIALHEGSIAEMGTGEGKTLVAILPAYLNALRQKGVHVVTVNDYLARRDAEWVGQPLRFLDVSVGIVQNGMLNEQKQKAYRCDVTYVTNSELGFDYLRDQMAAEPSDLVLRERDPFQFAIIDEVDSILIDEARTPLIISGEAQQTSGKYQMAREVANTLKRNRHYTVDEKGKQCILIEAGVDAAVELLGKPDLFDPEDPWFPFISNALNAKELYLLDKSYIVKDEQVMIVDEFTGRVLDGRRWSSGLHQAVEAKEGVPIQPESVTLASISYQSLFRLFSKLSGMTGTAATEAEEFKKTYDLETAVAPSNRDKIRQDLDDQVFVEDVGKWKSIAREIAICHRKGRPVLVGTTTVENSEIVAELLDQFGVKYRLLNAKPENVTRETEIIAASGRKSAVTISTNMAGRGTDILLGGNASMMARLQLREQLFPRLFAEKAEQWMMPSDFYPVELSPETASLVGEEVQKAFQAWELELAKMEEEDGDAVSGPTTGASAAELEAEERLSKACAKSPIDEEILIGLRGAFRAIEEEYKVVTDLGKQEVVELGGLYVIGTERHESRRIDNQLRGRCARQGDPGQTRFFLSLNDTIFRIFGGEGIRSMTKMLTGPTDLPLESGLLTSSLDEAQKKVENYYYSIRKNVLEYDEVMDTQRKIIYELRRKALLDGDDIIKATLFEFIDRVMEDLVEGNLDVTDAVETWPLDQLANNVGRFCELMKETVSGDSCSKAAADGGAEGLTAFLQEKGREALSKKYVEMDQQQPGLSGVLARAILLMQIDDFWKRHLQNMDFLRRSVSLRAYGQKNPLTEYKLEGYSMFLKIMARIRRNVAYNIFLCRPREMVPEASPPPASEQEEEMLRKLSDPAALQEAVQALKESGEAGGSTAAQLASSAMAVPLRDMLQNPAVREMLEDLAKDPVKMQEMIAENAALQALAKADPALAQLLNDPEIMQQAFSPDMVDRFAQHLQAAPASDSTEATVPENTSQRS